MLDGVHAEAGKWFDVCVPMVQGVYVLIECFNMKEPVRKVKVKLTDNGDKKNSCNKNSKVFVVSTECPVIAQVW